ncbi:helix-hairpin-helix domain-containing protein [Arthrobacter sp. UYEF3]|uniref:helix-hairpin-helix domain-containing protein n=1 Tax=Arthrobacter sp. UYEF3 TaxID=1756365 RepID=UPI0033993D0F
MSRHYPGAEARSASGSATGLARHRWVASLGPAPDDALLDDVLPDGVAADAAAAEPAASGGPAGAAFRWRTGRRAAALLTVLCVLLGGWFWWQAADGAPRVQPLGEPPGSEPAGRSRPVGTGSQAAIDGGTAGPADPAAVEVPGAPAGSMIVVHVAGAVASPGVIKMPGGSRLHEAIMAAGGGTAAADLDRLNLAAVLEDGQKILVPERGSPAGAGAGDGAVPSAGTGGTGPGGTGPGSTGAPAAKINLNTAGVEELATLPRVGPVLAQRIVDWRKQHGSFRSVEELDAVEGVGPKLLAALLPLVRI